MNLRALSLAALCLLLAAAVGAETAKPAARATRPAARRPAVVTLPAAGPDQLEAAERVFYGHYECELNQAIDIAASARNPGYVDVRHGKLAYVMKPVLSSTGAIRLEDVKGRTLMVQIATKSMLMDVKAGRRLVDDCVSPKQREAIEAAQVQAAEAAASAAAAASAPASAASAPAEPASTPASAPGQ